MIRIKADKQASRIHKHFSTLLERFKNICELIDTLEAFISAKITLNTNNTD